MPATCSRRARHCGGIVKTAIYGMVCWIVGLLVGHYAAGGGLFAFLFTVLCGVFTVGVGVFVEALIINAWHWGDRHDKYDN